jgi:hypothetical protein
LCLLKLLLLWAVEEAVVVVLSEPLLLLLLLLLQITGDRPPVGTNGVPASAQDSPREICSTMKFSYGMIFGPLLPVACGTYEVSGTRAVEGPPGGAGAALNTPSLGRSTNAARGSSADML